MLLNNDSFFSGSFFSDTLKRKVCYIRKFEELRSSFEELDKTTPHPQSTDTLQKQAFMRSEE